MAEEYCYPFTRKSLEDYYEMTWRCAKCAYCRNYLPSDTEEERFGRQCPPGERFKYESYFASGRNEIARRIVEGKQGLTERYDISSIPVLPVVHVKSGVRPPSGVTP